MDDNGRMGRFLMNTMMAVAGCPWTSIPPAGNRQKMWASRESSMESRRYTGIQ
jgi:hypothetical protein